MGKERGGGKENVDRKEMYTSEQSMYKSTETSSYSGSLSMFRRAIKQAKYASGGSTDLFSLHFILYSHFEFLLHNFVLKNRYRFQTMTFHFNLHIGVGLLSVIRSASSE